MMNTAATYFRISLTAALIIAGSVDARADDECTRLDCGVNSLYMLPPLEGGQ